MTESKSPQRAGIKRVPRPLLIDPNQRYTLAETHAVLGHSHVKTFQDIKRGHAPNRQGRSAAIRPGE